jgi:hypothetical protein
MTNPFELGPSEDSEPSRRSGFSSSCWSCEKVKLVFRDFPIDGLHPQARKAAVGTHADAVQKDVDEGDSSWRDRHAGILRERRVALGGPAPRELRSADRARARANAVNEPSSN